MRVLVLFTFIVNIVKPYDDELLYELTADLRKMLESELTLPVTSELTDEELQSIQSIEGSGDDGRNTILPIFVTTTTPIITTTTATTTTTTTITTTPTTHFQKKIMPHKLQKICVADSECFSDSDCGRGKCYGTYMGTCNCRACIPARMCTEDSDCGGLRGGCHMGQCHCERALAFHGFNLMVDAVLSFCDQKTCKAYGNDCHGLPCHIGKCRCTGH